MEVQGKIKVIGETQSFGTGDFTKRELVVTTDEQYPQHISIDFIKDKCSLLDNFSIGQTVKVSINLGGRVWNDPKTGKDRYFNSITGWRIEALQDAMQQAISKIDNAMPPANDDGDDLPF